MITRGIDMAKILVLEDDKLFLPSLLANLEIENHEVTCITDAFELYKNIDIVSNYKILILDLMMKKSTELQNRYSSSMYAGEIVYHKIREKYKDKQIIIMTSVGKNVMPINIENDKNILVLYKPLGDDSIEQILQFIG